MKMIWNMVQGFCMALADSVPGVSGGTVAFILGFYDTFILSLHNLVSGTKKQRKKAIIFLGKLMCGWVLGFGLCVLTLGSVFDRHIYSLCSLFLGLSMFALPLMIHEEREVLKNRYQNVIFTAAGAGIVGIITYLNTMGTGNSTRDLSVFSIGTVLYVFVVAMIAISAMVLPGISGSTLLLIFGLYVPVMNAIKEVLHLHMRYVPILFVFGMGVLTGIVSVIHLVKTGLQRYRSQTIYLILGLMIGSFYAIVMGPTTLDTPQAAMTLTSFEPLFFMLGAVILAGLQILKHVAAKVQEKHSEVVEG